MGLTFKPYEDSPDYSVIDVILDRHSVSPKRLGFPEPNEAQIHTMISAAAAAPDHGKLRPWRFIQFPTEHRKALADIFEAALLERLPAADQDSLNRAREKASRAPILLGLILNLNADAAIPHVEDQIASGGAALQNLLLAAHAMGFGARALSGQAVRTNVFRKALGLSDSETFLCFVAIGTPTAEPKRNQRPAPETILSQWNGKPNT